MSFTPLLPATGYPGWVILKKTLPAQQAALRATAENQREAAYFQKNIVKVTSAEDLVADRRLLKVALTAFGLAGDIDSKAFIRKVLSDNPETSGALANRLADKSYLALSKTFALDGMRVPNTLEAGFAEAVINQYYLRSFETAVGAQNSSYRLALHAERDIGALAASGSSEDVKWFTIMGSKPMRAVVETAFGMPASFGRMNIDQQLKFFKSRAASQFGDASVSQFSDPKKLEKLVRTYLIRASLDVASISPARSALELLGGLAAR